MSEIITDAEGRKISLRKLNVLDQVKLLRAVGHLQSTNQPYVEIVTMAAMVESIDGVPVPFPTSERSIDANIARIGDAGFGALMVEMNKQASAVIEAAEAAASGEAEPADPLAQSAQ